MTNNNLNRTLNRLVGQIFRLLPSREEGLEYLKPMDTLIVEITGLAKILDDDPNLLSLLSKLTGLREMGKESDFMLYRRTILEMCSLMGKIRDVYVTEYCK